MSSDFSEDKTEYTCHKCSKKLKLFDEDTEGDEIWVLPDFNTGRELVLCDDCYHNRK